MTKIALTDDQKLIVIKLIGDKRDILLNSSIRPADMEKKCLGWNEIVRECRDDYDFDPIPLGHGWQYLRDSVFKVLRLAALKRKKKNKELTETDIEILALQDHGDKSTNGDGDAEKSGESNGDGESDKSDDDVSNKAVLPPVKSADPAPAKRVYKKGATDSSRQRPPSNRIRYPSRLHTFDDDTDADRAKKPRRSLVTNGSAHSSRQFGIGHAKVDEFGESTNDDSEMKIQLLEAKLEFYKNQAEVYKQQTVAFKHQMESFKSEVEVCKNRATFWELKAEAIRMGLGKRGDMIMNNSGEKDLSTAVAVDK